MLAERPVHVPSDEPAGSAPAVAGGLLGIPVLPSMSDDASGLGFVSSGVPTDVDAVADIDGTVPANRIATLAT